MDIDKLYEATLKNMVHNTERVDELQRIIQANQPIIDGLVIGEGRKINNKQNNFQSAWEQKMNEVWGKDQSLIQEFQSNKNAKLTFELKVANMTSGAHVTGDVVQGYNPRQGLVSSHSFNFRQLIPSISSPTGSYVTYRETGSTGSISVQTEGQPKTQIDYSFTEVKQVSNYIAGFACVSKQMMYNLPFLNQTLPRMLLRDFYKKENDYFYGAAYLAATGNATLSGVNDAEELLSAIANQRNADFEPSFILINWDDWQALLKTAKNDQGYSLPGGVTWDSNGNLKIAGVSLIGASWVTAGEPLLLDTSMIERIETESLRVEFSFEDNDNFRRNMVTARVECFEELNILRPDSIIGIELGGS